ncbi:phosphotransferase family protein [Nakamurella sp. GG22]
MTAGVDRLRALLAAHLPDYEPADIHCVGAGVDHVAYLVGGELIVRLAQDPAYGTAEEQDRATGGAPGEAEREAQLLRLVAEYSTLPVPVPLVATDGLLAYRALPGVPLLSRSQDWRRAHAADLGNVLGRFLASLHSIPTDSLTGIAEVDDEPLSGWLVEARECWDAIGDWAATASGLPQDSLGRIQRFLAAPPPPRGDEICFTHNDLGSEHVLIDPASGAITGVIDWTDAAVADPAVDLGLVLRDLGDEAFHAAARQVPGGEPEGLRERALFYARCRSLEDMGFGIENDRPEYVANTVAAADRLFLR